MAAWKLVKDLTLDLSVFNEDQVQVLINNLESGEIKEILSDLEDARAKNIEREEWLDLALTITKIVLTKGIILS
jgi:hypothetical protein|tara:strand:- start:3008 stop:3229 length:222 start_codon:yes stop_codon:yes gene_type:complete